MYLQTYSIIKVHLSKCEQSHLAGKWCVCCKIMVERAKNLGEFKCKDFVGNSVWIEKDLSFN